MTPTGTPSSWPGRLEVLQRRLADATADLDNWSNHISVEIDPPSAEAAQREQDSINLAKAHAAAEVARLTVEIDELTAAIAAAGA